MAEITIPENIKVQIPLLAAYGINTQLRLAHFLAQCHHESAGFTARTENLNYSAQGLRAVFPKYFPDNLTALKYERKPQAIANKVYANRLGNGAETSGDGYLYRGRGYIQLTGKSNYAAFGGYVNKDFIADPDSVADKYALISAAWFFLKNGINEVADKGDSKEAVTAVTKKVNGGVNGLAERIILFGKYNSLKLL